MMSLETIEALSREQGLKARRLGKEPFTVRLSDLESYRTTVRNGQLPFLPFPNIGSYRPPGWTMLRKIFCDKSGWGRENEPAVTVRSLIMKELKEDLGYAIIEEGPFQIYLGEFRKLSPIEVERSKRRKR